MLGAYVMRKTKIVCTIGPATDSEEVMIGLCKAGMNVARLNFSHGTYEDHQYRIDLVKKVREDLNLPIAIMLDTKGPEYRIRTFKEGKIYLNDGDKFTFTTDEVEGDEHRVSVSYANLPNELQVGDTILLNNGLLQFEVTAIDGADIHTTVVEGGELSNRKSMSFPGKVMKQKYLSDQDKADIAFGVQNGVDFIACSFVSCAQDLIDVQEYLKELGAPAIELIAKIENQSGVDNIEEICKYCEGIMSKLVVEVEAQGFQYFDWNVDSRDASTSKTTQDVINNVIGGIKKKDYSVVLQHDIRGYSVDAVESIIQWGLNNGYTFMALDSTSPGCHQNISN